MSALICQLFVRPFCHLRYGKIHGMNNNSWVGCPFCRSNQLLSGDVLAENDQAYLVKNVRFPGSYLIIPEAHIESPLDLPDDWWHAVKNLLAKVSMQLNDYNLIFNIGTESGQSVRHLHLWVVPRNADEPASGKGLNALIEAYNQHIESRD